MILREKRRIIKFKEDCRDFYGSVVFCQSIAKYREIVRFSDKLGYDWGTIMYLMGYDYLCKMTSHNYIFGHLNKSIYLYEKYEYVGLF